MVCFWSLSFVVEWLEHVANNLEVVGQPFRSGWTHRASERPVDPSFRALSGRLKFTVRRHKFIKDSLLMNAAKTGHSSSLLSLKVLEGP